MEPTEKELKDRLRDFGIRLASPPSDVDELLHLLDETEIYLSRVEQSPSKSMSDALGPAMNSLITKEFLNHPETDVKVFVAACINEITRITAPDAPYNDALMKEIFAMIVDSFGKLDDISGCSYSKRVSIIETVAKVRSCVVMLDLECDDLILQMFKHFLQSIRPDHPMNVFSSMETIMTLVLEESEDISQELLMYLLSNVQKSKKGVMPVACKLAEKVIHNCAMKLKPYILVSVQSMGTSLSDYSDIVASVCQESSVAPEQKEADDSKLSERTVSDELPPESEKLDKPVSCLEEVGNFADKARKVLSNGVMPLGNGNPVAEQISQELKPDNSFSSEQCRNDIASRGENNSLGSITEKPGNELDLKYIEAKSSSVQLTDASDSSRVDGDKEASAPTIRRAGRKRKTKRLKSDGASDLNSATEVLLKPEREAELQPLEALSGDNTCVNPPGNDLPKRGRATNSQISAMESTTHKPVPSAGNEKNSGSTTMENEGLHVNTLMEKEGSPAIVSKHKKDNCHVSNLDGKPSLDSAKKSLEDNATAVIEAAVIGDGKSLRKEQKESATKVSETNPFGKHWKSNIKRPKGKDVTEKDVPAEPCLKEMIVSSKASREASNDQNHMGKFLETNSRKRKKHRRKTSGVRKIHLEIVGREIEVWWPDDSKFYKGVIDAFDPITKKHRVVYEDGDVEILFLRNELWQFIDSNNPERGQENDIASPEYSLQMPMKNPRASSGKSRATPERGKSGGKSKHMPIQQSDGGKSAIKSRGRPRRVTSKVGSSPNEKGPESYDREGTKVESSQMINSDEPPEDSAIVKDNTSSKVISEGKSKGKNIFPSGGGTPVIRSMDRPSAETSRIGSSSGRPTETVEKYEGTEIESHQTKNSWDDTSTGAKLDGKSKGRPAVRSGGRKSALKSRGKRRGKTLQSSIILDGETVKTPSKEKRIKVESYQTKYSDVVDTSAFKKLGNISSEGPKARRKRKGTEVVTTDADANVFVIKNSEGQGGDNSDVMQSDVGSSQRSAMKPNNKRRRK